ncbi:MAG: sucrase ferredoxin [Gaiellaceae bacterium]
MPDSRRPLCADISGEAGEPPVATASRIDHWLLVEYPGLWSRDVLGGSLLSADVKRALREQLAKLSHSRLLFIRRPERRAAPVRRVYVARTLEGGGSLYGLEIGDYAELATLDLGAVLAGGVCEPAEHPLFVVCTHGKRDRCCARYGRPVYEGLREAAPEDWVWQSTHVGGDRFAGNVVCLPEGLYFGRVAPADVWILLNSHLAGRIHLPRYRGSSCHSFPVQAAEHEIREREGLYDIRGVRVLGYDETAPDTWTVRLAVGEAVHEVDVRREWGDLTYLTCEARTLQRPRRFVSSGSRVVVG